MMAGTMRMRTMLASSATATARPTPMALVMMMLVKANEPATTTMISAALVTMRPVLVRPKLTAAWLSCVSSHASRMRESRNTS